MTTNRRFRSLALGVTILSIACVATSCGGAGGGAGPSGAGQGLVLHAFLQGGVDNVALNQELEFQFSEAVNPGSISYASIQIRKGNAFGETISGDFSVQGAKVLFRPSLPGLCDLSDAGLDANTVYAVQITGYPESFSVDVPGERRVRPAAALHARLLR